MLRCCGSGFIDSGYGSSISSDQDPDTDPEQDPIWIQWFDDRKFKENDTAEKLYLFLIET
jgi:hypothetical protein